MLTVSVMLFWINLVLIGVSWAQGPATRPRPAAAAPAATAKPAPIPWSATRPLTLADFQGRPSELYAQAALTSADIKAGASCTNFVFSSTVQATFDPSPSWFRDPKKSSPALLRHEQTHFDLTEVYARLLRQKLLIFQAKADCNKLQPAFNNLTKGVYAAWAKEQSRYDAESNHGLNAARQAYWEQQVQVRLAQLATFAQ